MNKRLVVVAGPTASGKTSLCVALARHYGAPILSADSRQIYRRMEIGTAHPTAEELAAAPHHMIGICDPEEDFSAGRYETEALAILHELFKRHDTVIAVGGSGLYIDALCRGMDELPDIDPVLREELGRRLEKEGLPSLLAELERLDPGFYAQVDRANPRRVLRALEVCLASGQPYSSLRRRKAAPRPFDIIKTGTLLPRDELYRRIEARVDQMVAAGLEQEAQALYPLRDHNALQTVGYREWMEHFDGLTSREQAIAMIKQNTRRYAKRQMTWFSRDPDIAWFNPSDVAPIVKHIG